MDAFDLDFDDFEEPLLPDDDEAETKLPGSSRDKEAQGQAGQTPGAQAGVKHAGINDQKHPSQIERACKSSSAPCEQDNSDDFDCNNMNFHSELPQNQSKKSTSGNIRDLTNNETENMRSTHPSSTYHDETKSRTVENRKRRFSQLNESHSGSDHGGHRQDSPNSDIRISKANSNPQRQTPMVLKQDPEAYKRALES